MWKQHFIPEYVEKHEQAQSLQIPFEEQLMAGSQPSGRNKEIFCKRVHVWKHTCSTLFTEIRSGAKWAMGAIVVLPPIQARTRRFWFSSAISVPVTRNVLVAIYVRLVVTPLWVLYIQYWQFGPKKSAKQSQRPFWAHRPFPLQFIDALQTG